jgi:hypothetical protein
MEIIPMEPIDLQATSYKDLKTIMTLHFQLSPNKKQPLFMIATDGLPNPPDHIPDAIIVGCTKCERSCWLGPKKRWISDNFPNNTYLICHFCYYLSIVEKHIDKLNHL